jgi:hypothetical protein
MAIIRVRILIVISSSFSKKKFVLIASFQNIASLGRRSWIADPAMIAVIVLAVIMIVFTIAHIGGDPG